MYFSSAADTSSGSASRVPDASFIIRSPGPLARDVYAMRRPSGDHIGFTSAAASKVNRDETPRATSRIHTSPRVLLTLSDMSYATRMPSGENDVSR
jgi:hypothetical protein